MWVDGSMPEELFDDSTNAQEVLAAEMQIHAMDAQEYAQEAQIMLSLGPKGRGW